MTRFVVFALGATLAIALAASACGDDAAATDEEFALELCRATKTLETSLTAAIGDANAQTDPAKAVAALVGPLEEFVEAFEDADPPEDLEDWHNDAAGQLRDAVDKFKAEKTLASLQGFGDSPVPDPPADAKDRLRKAAESVEECEGVAFLKPD